MQENHVFTKYVCVFLLLKKEVGRGRGWEGFKQIWNDICRDWDFYIIIIYIYRYMYVFIINYDFHVNGLKMN